jgi:hypothetical protein
MFPLLIDSQVGLPSGEIAHAALPSKSLPPEDFMLEPTIGLL